jgi:hypothetical protein
VTKENEGGKRRRREETREGRKGKSNVEYCDEAKDTVMPERW